jgi:ABC-type antimicrobial peptide transport system permease subunit
VWAPGLSADDLVARIAGPVSALAPNHTPVVRLETFARAFADDLAPIRFQWPILVTLGAFATTLTAVGLFSLVAYIVEQRRRDMGIRLALGAGRRQLAAAVVRLGLVPALIGLTIGLAIAASVQRVIAATTFGWPVAGYLAMALVAAAVLVIVVVAVVAPVRRVLALQPSEILRAE